MARHTRPKTTAHHIMKQKAQAAQHRRLPVTQKIHTRPAAERLAPRHRRRLPPV